MISLIKNELSKIFHKKGIYIIFVIMILYAILTNVIYKNLDDNFDEFDNFQLEIYRDDVKNLNPKNLDEQDQYLNSKTYLDLYKYSKKYSEDSWQNYVIKNDLYDIFYQENFYLITDEKDKKAEENDKQRKKEIEKILKKDNWRKYAEYQKRQIDERDSLELEIINLRLKENIKYQDDYLNQALNNYYEAKSALSEMKKITENSSYEEKKTYQDEMTKLELNRYIISHKKPLDTTASSHGVLKGFMDEYSFLILIMIIVVAGSIVSEEFSKGTIKLLLVRPYTRNKILTSKFITALLMIPLAFLVMLFIQVIIGGIVFGFESLSLPVLVYDLSKGAITKISLFSYVFLMFAAKMPMYILLATLAFALSTIFTNTALATVLAVMGNTVSGILNTLLTMLNTKLVNLFVTLNWDFTSFLFGGSSPYEGITFPFAVMNCIIYFIIMVIPTYIIFQKRNIKNI